MLNSLYKSVRLGVMGALIVGISCGCSRAPTATPAAQTPQQTKASVEGPQPDTAMERKVFYYPDDEVRGTKPSDAEEVRIETADGLKLVGWQLAPPDGAVLGVYFHGNGGNISSLGGVVDDYREAGLGVVIVDYRGFGGSEGEPSEEGLYLDGLAAFNLRGKSVPGASDLDSRSLSRGWSGELRG